MSEKDLELEARQAENLLRSYRREAQPLKPHYAKVGRPTRAEWEANGRQLTRKQWEALWARMGKKRRWGGKRNGAGKPKTTGPRTLRQDFSIKLELAETLAKLPKGLRSAFVCEALEFYLTIKPVELMKAPPARGRHAYPERKREGKRWTRMSKIEQCRYRLEQVRTRLAQLEEASKEGNQVEPGEKL